MNPDPRGLPDDVGPDEIARLEHRAAQERAARLEAERTAETQLRRAFERAREVELLASIAVIVNETDDALSAMSAAAKVVRRHCRFAVSHVLLREPDGAFATSDMWDADAAALDFLDTVMGATVDQRFAPSVGLPGEVGASHLAAWIPDLTVAPGRGRAGVPAGATWAFPILTGIEVVAVVEFLHPEPMPADERLLQLAPSLAAQLGRAVEWERAQLRQADDRRRLEELLAQRTQDVAALTRHGRGTDDARSSYAAWVVHELQAVSVDLRGRVGPDGTADLDRLDRLADVLVAIADGTERRIAGPRTAVSLRELVAQLASRHTAAGCPVVVASVPPGDHPVELALPLVTQALDELVGNALRHAQASEVRLAVSLEDNAVVLDVLDDGIGFTWDTPDRPTGGSGLAQTARLAAALGGTVQVNRLPEGGTRARLRVHAPVHVPAVQSDHSTRVLLVDDNDVNRRLAAAMLGKLGVSTDVVESGEAALEALRGTAYGLVLMDVQMPGMDGREATRAWRTHGGGATPADVPIVALTAHVGQTERDLCRDAGMVDYLSKPFGIDALSDMVQRWLEGAPARTV
ncbi:MAG: response regulator [Candidatus Nanopelagicales bacterium]